ncbi:MAG: Hsp20/alpha crystallin family protein [Bacteroidetes bacterium]|nr:MAG: Hsp20/alpha crystallin family protein [Bacteroidota bacterium]
MDMALIKFTPRFTPALPDLFGDFFNQEAGRNWSDVNTFAKVNVMEKNDAFQIEVAAPGLKKEDFQLQVDKDILSIRVQKENKQEESGEKYMRREFSFESFERRFQLPESVDQGKIEAKYENGVLYVLLPKKAEEVQKERMIEIA